MKPSISRFLYTLSAACFLLTACQKSIDSEEQLTPETSSAAGAAFRKPAHKYSSDVAQAWLDLQLKILRISGATAQDPAPNPYSLNGNRHFAYMGIALYETVLPGMPSYQSLAGQLNEMPTMPTVKNGTEYHWSAAANAALAYLTQAFYPNVSPAHKQAMAELEKLMNKTYQQQTDAAVLERSVAFGKDVAQRIFDWSKTDGATTAYPPYVLPTGEGIWSNTAPNPTGIFAPYWGNNRLFVKGSLDNTSSPLPPAYSTNPSSAYYAMVKEVYDISQTLTAEQIATARYFRDNPGFQAGTNYQFTFYEVMQKENLDLADYAVAQATVGMALVDAQIGCWKSKYAVLQERPCRYIRDVLQKANWNPLIPTPPHPDFPSGHSQTGGAFAAAMTSLFGNNYRFAIHTYDILNMAPRSYTSFEAMAEDIALSRVYGGIHYRYSCTEGKRQGMKIAQNVVGSVKLKK